MGSDDDPRVYSKGSKAFLELCKKLEESFSTFHGDKISKAPNAIELLSQKVSVKYNNNILNYICNMYLKVRFFNRIKYLNNVLKRKEAAEKIRDNIFLGLVLFTTGHKNLSVFKFVFSIFDIAISVEMLCYFIFSLLSPTIKKYCPYL